MPRGVETVLEDGFAVIDFVDPARRGPGLARLLEVGGAGTIDVLTRDGPRRKYRVPEGNARAAGFIDIPISQPLMTVPLTPDPDPTTQEMVAPLEEWTRADLELHGRRLGIKSLHNMPNKATIIAAIREKTGSVTRGDTAVDRLARLASSMEVPAGTDRFA